MEMRFLVVFIVLTSLFTSIQAQDCVSLRGKVVDDDRNPVRQALIAIEGTSIGTHTDEKGCYQLNVPRGTHTFSISEFEYQTLKRVLNINSSVQQDFTLFRRSVDLLSVEVHGKTKTQQLREGSFSLNAIDVKPYANSLNGLNDLIGRSSGVRIREDGGMGADFDLSINGLSGNSIRYFIDGVPLTTIGNGVSLANIPINLVERVEIYKGVVPANLGTDALGGAINIITKKNIKNYIDASYGAGSFHTHKADLNAQYTDQKTGIFIRPTLGVNYSKNDYMMKGVEVPDANRDGFETVNTRRFHDDYFSFLGQLNIGVVNKRWADLFAVTTSYSFVNKELQRGAVRDKVYGMAERKNKSYAIIAQYMKRDLFVKGLATDLSVSHTWDYSIVTDTAFRKYDWSGNFITASGNEIRGRAKSIGRTNRPLSIARANFDYQLNEKHSLNINYLLDHVKNKRSDDFDSEFVPSEDALTKHIIGFNYKQSFWDDKWTNSFFAKNYISHLKIGQRDLSWITGANDIPESTTTHNWGYGLCSRFRLAEWLAIKGSAERSIRLPLTRENMGDGSNVYPNFLLRPEDSRNYNFGLFGTINIGSLHRFYYETSLFYRGVKGYIRYDPAGDGTGQYQNLKDVTVKGVEGEIRYEYNNCIQAIANFSYLQEKQKSKNLSNGKPDVTYNNQIPNKPWLYSNFELNFRKKNPFGQKDNQLKIAYYFQYAHWFYLTWKEYATSESIEIIPTQCVSNVSLTYSLKNEKYNISFECNNLFDKLVYDNYMMQKPGRSFHCKFRIFIN